jgi:hypothetical protein
MARNKIVIILGKIRSMIKLMVKAGIPACDGHQIPFVRIAASVLTA